MAFRLLHFYTHRFAAQAKAILPQAKWQKAALGFAIAAFVTFIINLTFIMWATASRPANTNDGIGILLLPDTCSKTKAINTGIHVVVNIFSTILLSGSNYCMQCLMAPTRSEINEAHAKQEWMDIGVHSIRNFRRIRWKRRVSWLLLMTSSIPLHFLFNSTIFASTSVNAYWRFEVDKRFLATGDVYPAPSEAKEPLADIYRAYDQGLLENLSFNDCIRAYGSDFQSSRGSLIFISADDELTNYTARLEQMTTEGDTMSSGSEWANVETLNASGINYTTMTECHSQRTQGHCKLLYSKVLCWVVTTFNLFKAVIMLSVAFSNEERPLLSVGDAIASFIEEPDQTTKEMCLKSNQDFIKNDWTRRPRPFGDELQQKYLGAGTIRWNVLILGYSVSIVGCVMLLCTIPNDFGDLKPAELGSPKAGLILKTGWMGQDSTSLILNVIVANTFQVVQTLLYCNYNAICTSISLVSEWDRFGSYRKGLRVSAKPQGAQRQTYFLQLPFKHSIPMVIFSGLIHWLISQSIFVVSMELYGPSSENVMTMVPFAEKSFTSCGWSGFGVMMVAFAVLFMVVYLVIVGSWPLKFGKMPVVGSCSAAISAACHPGLDEPNVWEKPLQWGVVAASTTEPGHCSFSGDKVDDPQQGLLYA